MKATLADLERRHAELLARCAAEREAAAALGADLRAQLAPYDAGLEKTRRWLSSPAALGVGLALAAMLVRVPGLRRIGGLASLLGAALQLRAFLA